MGEFNVTQRTKDGYFDANELLGQWNGIKGNTKREMKKFLDGTSTKEFISALNEDIAQSQNCDMPNNPVFNEIKGRNSKSGRTKDQVWMHPYLFTKFAMWINPRFEVKVIKFVYDEMIKYRHEAGDAYKQLSSSVSRLVPKSFMPAAMHKTGEALNWVIFNSHEKGLRNKFGDEKSQRDLYELERKVSDLINDDFIKDYEYLIKYLRKEWAKRWDNTPKCLID